MSPDAESTPTGATANSAVLRVGYGPLASSMLARVVSMMLARAGCPVDRLDDALTICDALSAHACCHSADGHVEFKAITNENGLELRVGALADGGARGLLSDASLPGIGGVLEPIADELRIEAPPGQRSEELILALRFSPLTI